MSEQAAARRSVRRSGGVLLYFFLILLFLCCPPPLFGPAGCSSPRLPDSFCNEYVQRIPSLWNMMDEECRKYIHR